MTYYCSGMFNVRYHHLNLNVSFIKNRRLYDSLDKGEQFSSDILLHMTCVNPANCQLSNPPVRKQRISSSYFSFLFQGRQGRKVSKGRLFLKKKIELDI